MSIYLYKLKSHNIQTLLYVKMLQLKTNNLLKKFYVKINNSKWFSFVFNRTFCLFKCRNINNKVRMQQLKYFLTNLFYA